jgi:hypothetical protein
VADLTQPIRFSVIIARCPVLRELCFMECSDLIWPEQNQTAAKLVCVRLNCRKPAVFGPWQWHILDDYPAAKVLAGPAFSALERVVLDNFGGGVIDAPKWAALRAKGCHIEIA